MSKRDSRRTAHYSIQAQWWSLDVPPHKSTKKAKTKERQMAKKIIRDETR